jgi:hypothetical protein
LPLRFGVSSSAHDGNLKEKSMGDGEDDVHSGQGSGIRSQFLYFAFLFLVSRFCGFMALFLEFLAVCN